MATGVFKNLQRKLKQFDLNKEVADIANQRSPMIADAVRSQMYRGRTSTGAYIRPFYSEDPWFKSRAHMEAYRSWKQHITPDPDRPADVPNLYIVGYYHGGLAAKADRNKITYKNSAGNAAEIEAKYGEDKLYGLNPESQEDIQYKIKHNLVPRIILKVFR